MTKDMISLLGLVSHVSNNTKKDLELIIMSNLDVKKYRENGIYCNDITIGNHLILKTSYCKMEDNYCEINTEMFIDDIKAFQYQFYNNTLFSINQNNNKIDNEYVIKNHMGSFRSIVPLVQEDYNKVTIYGYIPNFVKKVLELKALDEKLKLCYGVGQDMQMPGRQLTLKHAKR